MDPNCKGRRMMDAFNKAELRRRMKAMSEEEQAEALKCFKSYLIANEYKRRLEMREHELEDIARVFMKYKE